MSERIKQPEWVAVIAKEEVYTKYNTHVLGEIVGSSKRALEFGTQILRDVGAQVREASMEKEPKGPASTHCFNASNWRMCSWEPKGPTPPYRDN